MTAPLELFTLEEVARTFRVSPRTMREHVKAHPYYRLLGGRRLFTRADIRALYEALKCPSSSSEDLAGRTGTCTAPSEASLYAKAQKLITEKRRKRSARSASGSSFNVVSMARKQPPHSYRRR